MAIDKEREQQFINLGAREGRIVSHIKGSSGAALATAATTRMLVQLRQLACSKPITSLEIQIVIDNHFHASGMEEVETQRGGVVYRRKVAA